MFDFGMTHIEEAASRPGGAVMIDETIARLVRTGEDLADRMSKTSHPAELAHIEKIRKGVEAACFVLRAFRTTVSDQQH